MCFGAGCTFYAQPSALQCECIRFLLCRNSSLVALVRDDIARDNPREVRDTATHSRRVRAMHPCANARGTSTLCARDVFAHVAISSVGRAKRVRVNMLPGFETDLNKKQEVTIFCLSL